MWHYSDIIDVDEMTHPANDEYYGEWEEVCAVGNPKGKGKWKSKGKDKSVAKGTGKDQHGKHRNQERAGNFPYGCHNSRE